MHDAVLEGRLVEQRRRQHRQGVEPAPCLIESLDDEMSWEVGLEALLVLEGVVNLAVGHGPGFAPAVQYLRDPLQARATTLGRNLHLIDKMLVEVVHLAAAQLGEFGAAAHTHRLTGFLVAPDGQRCAPVAVAADGPVPGPL